MRMIVDPLTGRMLGRTTRLEFNWKSMWFESLSPGERLLQITPLKEKDEVRIVKGNRVEFDPLKGEHVLLQKGEKLQYAHKKGGYVVKRRRKLVEWLRSFLSPKEKQE